MKKALLSISLIASIFTASAQDWSQIIKKTTSDRSENDQFGWACSISGDYAIVGARYDSSDANNANLVLRAGSAYVFERDGFGEWQEVQKLVASDRQADAQFGWSVSISGNYAVIGAPEETKDELGNNPIEGAGAAYVFERNISGTWVEVAKLVASDRTEDDRLSRSVSVSGDYIFAGAPNEDDDLDGNNFVSSSGSVYVYKRNNLGEWNQSQKLIASNRLTGGTSFFGWSVSVDGTSAAISGHAIDVPDTTGTGSLVSSGAAYIFDLDNNTDLWSETTMLVSSDRGSGDSFGRSLSMSGGRVVVGARSEDHDVDGDNFISNSGSAYVFERDGSGQWNQIQKLVASDREQSAQFGRSVSISGDFILVGVPSKDENAVSNVGAAYVFRRSNTMAQWVQIEKLTAPDGSLDDNFGRQVCISDGDAFVGAAFEDENFAGLNTLNSAGSLYIFNYDPTPCTLTGDTTVVACNSFIWYGTEYTTSGSPTYTFLSPSGCDSVVTLDLTINTVSDLTVSLNGATLMANYTNADSYQWLDCDNGDIEILAETNQTYMPSANGNYSVEITENGCVDTSDCVAVLTVGILENARNSVAIYPNPTDGIIGWSTVNAQTAEVFDNAGRSVLTLAQPNGTIDISELTSGIYILKLFTEEGAYTSRLVKQ